MGQFNPGQQAVNIRDGSSYVTDFNKKQLEEINKACQGKTGFRIVVNKIQRELRMLRLQQMANQTEANLKEFSKTFKKNAKKNERNLSKLHITANKTERKLGRLETIVQTFHKDLVKNTIQTGHISSHLSQQTPSWLSKLTGFIKRLVAGSQARQASYLPLQQLQPTLTTRQKQYTDSSLKFLQSFRQNSKLLAMTMKRTINRCPEYLSSSDKKQYSYLISFKEKESSYLSAAQKQYNLNLAEQQFNLHDSKMQSILSSKKCNNESMSIPSKASIQNQPDKSSKK